MTTALEIKTKIIEWASETGTLQGDLEVCINESTPLIPTITADDLDLLIMVMNLDRYYNISITKSVHEKFVTLGDVTKHILDIIENRFTPTTQLPNLSVAP